MVVCANRIRVIGQGAGKQRLHRLIRRALNAGKQANARLRQRLACPGANAAANQRVHLQPGQKTRQGPMAAALCGCHLRRFYFTILHIIHLESLGMAKVRKHHPAFIGYGNFHFPLPFLFSPVCAHRNFFYHTSIFLFWQCPNTAPLCKAGRPPHKMAQKQTFAQGMGLGPISISLSEVFYETAAL